MLILVYGNKGPSRFKGVIEVDGEEVPFTSIEQIEKFSTGLRDSFRNTYGPSAYLVTWCSLGSRFRDIRNRYK